MQIETHLLNEINCFRYPSADATYALIVSHGLGGHGGIYNTFCEHHVAKGAELWCYDAPGHGRSTPNRPRGTWTMDEWAQASRDWAAHVHVLTGLPVFTLGSSLGVAAAISAIGGFAVGLAGDSEKAAGRFFNGGIALLRENRAALPDVDAATVNLETAFYAAALLWAIIGGDLDVVRSGAVNSAAFNLALQVADDEQALANDYVRAALFHLRSIAAEQDPRQLGRVHQSLDFVDPGAEPPAIDLATALVGVIVTMLSESGFAPVDAEYDPMTASLALAQAASAGAEMTPIATYVDRCVRARDDGVDLAAVLGAVLGGSLRGSLLEEIRASSPVDDVDGELPSRPPVDLDTAIGSGIRDAINATSPAEAWRVAQELLRSRSISELSEAVDEFVSSVR